MQLEANSSGFGSKSAPVSPGQLHNEFDKRSSAVQLVVFTCWCAFALFSVLAISGCENGIHQRVDAGTIAPVAMNSMQTEDHSTLFTQAKLNARFEELPAQF